MSDNVTIEYIDTDRSWRIFDSAARRELGISGEEFAQRWDAGEFADKDEIEVMRVAMLRPRGG